MKRVGQQSLMSALKPLQPSRVYDTKSGELVTSLVLQEKVHELVSVVRGETIRLYGVHKSALLNELQNYSGRPQPAEFARQSGFRTSFMESLPREVMAKSRLEKLAQFKLISETDSYVKNPQGNKQEPSFSQSVNLGAVDKQMASLSVSDGVLSLLWKCWDREFLLEFNIPNYILERDILKYSLPVIKINQRTQQYSFIFTITEKVKSRNGKKHCVGIDLGVIKPYSMVVINQDNARVASYESSPRLNRLARKRERLISESHHIKKKLKNNPNEVLDIEYSRTRNKATRLTHTIAQQSASEITQKLTKHNANLIKVENLSWVSGTKNAKIGKSNWSHSKQQDAITHATKRIGYSTVRVSARNTSQECHSCKNLITHSSRTRTVYCAGCKTILDRDFNAAMNIAQREVTLPRPASKKLNGINTQVTSTGALLGTLVIPHDSS